jgi:hypothetical protein
MGTKQALNHTKVSAVDSMYSGSTTTSRFRATRETPIGLVLTAIELYALYTSGTNAGGARFRIRGARVAQQGTHASAPAAEQVKLASLVASMETRFMSWNTI